MWTIAADYFAGARQDTENLRGNYITPHELLNWGHKGRRLWLPRALDYQTSLLTCLFLALKAGLHE